MQVIFISVTRISSCKLNVKFILVFVFQERVIAECEVSIHPKNTSENLGWKLDYRRYWFCLDITELIICKPQHAYFC